MSAARPPRVPPICHRLVREFNNPLAPFDPSTAIKCLWVSSTTTSHAAAKRERPCYSRPLGNKSRVSSGRSGKPIPEQRRRLKRSVPFDRNPTPGSDLWIVVPDGEMLNAAIIPNDNRMRSPAKPHLEICACAVLE